MASHAKIDAAGLLLEYVPLSERTAAVNNVAKQITPSSTLTDVGLLASLLQLQPEHTAKQTLLENLSDRIENGQAIDVASFCEAYPSLREQILHHSVANIERVAKIAQHDKKWLSVPMSTIDAAEIVDGSPPDSEEQVRVAIAQAVSHFASVGAGLSHLNGSASESTLFRSCLILVGALDQKLASEAQRTLSRMISESYSLASSERGSLWRRIQELMQAGDKHYRSMGSAIWLRWAMSPAPMDASTLEDPTYWRLLVNGLRHGDSERRKGVLQILRASVDNVAEMPALSSHIVMKGQNISGAWSAEPCSPLTVSSIYYRNVHYSTSTT
jgi:tRNA guanosine-2'-O-methyltransferase